MRTLRNKIAEGIYSQGWDVVGPPGGSWAKALAPVEKYIGAKIAKAIKAEREACAKLCDELDAKNWSDYGEYASGYSENIRARGQE